MWYCAVRSVPRLALPVVFAAAVLAAGCSKDDGPATRPAPGGAGGFASGTLAQSAQFTFTFTDSGSFGYHCGLHPSVMKGAKVVVSDTAASMNAAVQIVSLSTPGFSPATVAIRRGGSVTWTNGDVSGMPHSVVSD